MTFHLRDTINSVSHSISDNICTRFFLDQCDRVLAFVLFFMFARLCESLAFVCRSVS